MSSQEPSWKSACTEALITSRLKLNVFNQDIRSAGEGEEGYRSFQIPPVHFHMNPSHHCLPTILSLVSSFKRGAMSPITERMWQQVVTFTSFDLGKDRIKGWIITINQITPDSKYSILSPLEHGVPGLQDLAVLEVWGWIDDLGEQQPGPCSMISLSVWDKVIEKRRCELVLFGPDGEGPAEIPTGAERERVSGEVSLSLTSFYYQLIFSYSAAHLTSLFNPRPGSWGNCYASSGKSSFDSHNFK